MWIAGIDPSINGTGVYTMKLDDVTLDIVEQNFMSFTTVKKYSDINVYYYRKKQFKDRLDQNIWMHDKIMEHTKECTHVSIEDYAYNAHGQVFHIGEYVGGLKQIYYRKEILIRQHEPPVVKMFGTGKGNCDKIRMCDEYDKLLDGQIDLKNLPQYKSPKEDVVDAYYLCKLLRLELLLRMGIVKLEDCTEKQIQIFNRVTKAYPVNILARPFVGEEDY